MRDWKSAELGAPHCPGCWVIAEPSELTNAATERAAAWGLSSYRDVASVAQVDSTDGHPDLLGTSKLSSLAQNAFGERIQRVCGIRLEIRRQPAGGQRGTTASLGGTTPLE